MIGLFQLDALVAALLPLALVAALAAALPPVERWRALAGAALAGVALAAADLPLFAIAQFGAALLLGRNGLARLGGGLGGLATLWLGWSAGAWRWSDAALGAGFGWPHVAAWLIAAVLLLNLPAVARAATQGVPDRPAPLLAISGLYPLFRMYQLGPIAWWWAWAGAALGLLLAGLALRTLLGPALAIDRARLAVLALWAAALPALLLASEAGLAAAWLLLAAALYLDGVREIAPLAGLGPALLGLWLAAAAALAGGTPLASAGLIGLALLYPLLLGQLPARSGTAWMAARLALAGGLALSLTAPLGLWLLMRPLWRQLGAGLTPFGRLMIEPWIGLSVRNAGSQTVAALPLLVLAGLALFGGSAGYLLLRGLRRDPAAGRSGEGRLADATLWRLVWRNLPTAPRPRPGQGTPDEL